jgi:hypothetical protein
LNPALNRDTEKATLEWLVEALVQARSGGQTKLVGWSSRRPVFGSWLTGAESCTTQVCPQTRCIRKLDFPVEASAFEVSSTGNALSVLLARWRLHGVKKAWPKRQAWHLYC